MLKIRLEREDGGALWDGMIEPARQAGEFLSITIEPDGTVKAWLKGVATPYPMPIIIGKEFNILITRDD